MSLGSFFARFVSREKNLFAKHKVESTWVDAPRLYSQMFSLMVGNAYRFELSLQQSLLTTLQGQARWARREGHVAATIEEPEFLNHIAPTFLRKLSTTAVDFVYP